MREKNKMNRYLLFLASKLRYIYVLDPSLAGDAIPRSVHDSIMLAGFFVLVVLLHRRNETRSKRWREKDCRKLLELILL